MLKTLGEAAKEYDEKMTHKAEIIQEELMIQ